MTKEVANNQMQEEKIDLKEFVENLPVGLYQVDTSGRFVYCNRTMAQILGYPNSSELIGSEIKDFYFNPEDRDRLIRKMRKDGWKFLDETLHWKTKQNIEIFGDAYGNAYNQALKKMNMTSYVGKRLLIDYYEAIQEYS